MAERYSAGTIFLQVAPSYDGFMEDVRRKAKEANRAFVEEQEKAAPQRKAAARKQGKEEAEEYQGAFRTALKRSLETAEREIKAIRIDADTKPVQDKIREVEKRIAALKDVEIGVDLTAREAYREILQLEAALAALAKAAKDMDVDFDIREGLRKIGLLRREVERQHPEMKVGIDAKEADKKLGLFLRQARAKIEKALGNIPAIEPHVDMTAAQYEAAYLRRELERLMEFAIEGRLDSASFLLELRGLMAAAERAENDAIDIEAKVNLAGFRKDIAEVVALTNFADAQRIEIESDIDHDGLRKGGDLAAEGAGSFRALSGAMLAVAVLGPVLVPVLAAVAAGLGGIVVAATAVVAGLGVLALGLSGIGGTLKAMADVEKNAAKDALAASKTMRNAARTVRDAEQGLERARQSAADAAEDAARRVERAREGVARAEQQAAERIGAALQRQQRAARELAEAQRDATRAQEGLTEARRQAAEDNQDIAFQLRQNALDERQALIALFNATVADTNARQDPGATNLEREETSIALDQARLNMERIRAEGERLAREQRQREQEGIEGSDRVQAAHERLTDALQRQEDAQRAVGEAAREVDEARVEGARMVRDANREVADALRAQARTERDNAIALRDANERLIDAQASYQEALQQTGEIGSASMQKLREEMEKLSPAGLAFATFLFSMRGYFQELRELAQEGMLPGLQAMLEGLFGRYGGGFKNFVSDMSQVLGRLFATFGQVLQGPAFTRFFEMMATSGPVLLELFGESMIYFLEALASMAVAFAPFAETMMRGFRDLMVAFSEWAASDEGQASMRNFIGYVMENAGPVLEFFWEMVKAGFALAKAMAPIGLLVMEGLTWLFEQISAMDPNLLRAIVIGLLALFLAFQVGMLILTFTFNAALIAANATLFAVVGVVVAVVAAFAILYTSSETFRDIVDTVFSALATAAKFLWFNVLQPVFNAIWETFKFLGEVFWTIGDIIVSAFRRIWEDFKEDWDKFANSGWGGAIIGFFTGIWDMIVGGAKAMWEDIKSWFEGGVRLVVTVLNEGLVDPLNWLAEKVGADSRITRIKMPFGSAQGTGANTGAQGGPLAFASGGRVPGWSPTATADNIPAMLTAGEYVLPVNAVRALRAKYGDGFLELLRQGLPGYAKGGLVEFGRLLQSMGARVAEHPAFGGVRGKHAPNSYHYKGQAIDVNTRPGTSAAEQRELARFVAMAKDWGLRAIFMTAGHFGHAHFDTGGGRSLLGKIGDVASGVLGNLKDAAGNVLSPVKWLVSKMLDVPGVNKLRESAFGQILLAPVKNAITQGVDWLREIAPGDFMSNTPAEEPQLYSRGGEVKLYDNGGWLQPGLTTVLNASGRPEPVFTADQFDEFLEGGGAGAGWTINVPMSPSRSTPAEVADEVLFAARQIRRGGVHSAARRGRG